MRKSARNCFACCCQGPHPPATMPKRTTSRLYSFSVIVRVSRVEVHPQARPPAKSRRVGPHRGPPTPRPTRLLAAGHQHLARPSKESAGCCWWVESSKYHAYCRRAAAEMAATSTWVMLVSGVCAICGGEISRKFQVSTKRATILDSPTLSKSSAKKDRMRLPKTVVRKLVIQK